MTSSGEGSSRDAQTAAYLPYLLISEHGAYVLDGGEPKAMYRLACRECGEVFEEGVEPVPSRTIKGAPLVHEECA